MTRIAAQVRRPGENPDGMKKQLAAVPSRSYVCACNLSKNPLAKRLASLLLVPLGPAPSKQAK